jgi:hypothetical protein
VGTLLKAQTLEKQAKQESKKALTAPKPKDEKNPQKGEKKSGPLFKSKPWKAEPLRFQKEVFTPLNASLIEVLSAIKGDLAFRWPPKMKTDPFRRDRSKWKTLCLLSVVFVIICFFFFFNFCTRKCTSRMQYNGGASARSNPQRIVFLKAKFTLN